MGQLFNPAYVFLNVFGLTLVAKLQAEQYIRKSGIDYTTIRPGGLGNEPPTGNIVMEPEDTLYEGTISRDQVAEVAVESLVHPESSFKVVEIVSHPDAPKPSFKDLLGSINNSPGLRSVLKLYPGFHQSIFSRFPDIAIYRAIW
ncbi:hypothetical protein CRYUN_Cryun37aG0084900 [Craigia yunnanensis]